MSPSHCDGNQQTSPFAYSRTATYLAGQNIHNGKLPQTKDFLLKPVKDNSDIPSTLTMLSDDSNFHFTSRIPATKRIDPGVEDFISFSDTNATQDFSCARSLLSTNPWDLYETKSISLEHSNRTTSTAQAIAHSMNRGMPLSSSEYWHNDRDQQVNSNMWISNSNCEDRNHFQEF